MSQYEGVWDTSKYRENKCMSLCVKEKFVEGGVGG